MNEELGPLGVTFDLIRRVPGQIEICWHNRIEVQGWVLWGASTVDQAYNEMATSGVTGTCSEMFRVRKDQFYRSLTPRQKGWGVFEDSDLIRGKFTRALFSVDDFVTSSNSIPMDNRMLFLRTQVLLRDGSGISSPLVVAGAANTGDPVLGPIYVVPPASSFGFSDTSLTLRGTAPTGTGCSAGAPPVMDLSMQTPLPLHLVFPKAGDGGFITNFSESDDLLYSHEVGMPMTTIEAGHTIELKGHFKQLILASNAATAITFDVTFTMNNTPHE